MNRVLLLPILALCFGTLQKPALAQEVDQDHSLRALTKKLDLLIERIDAIDRRLEKVERNQYSPEFSLLRPSDKSRTADDTKPAPLIFDLATPLPDEREGKTIYSGIEEGMLIDALQRKARRSSTHLLQQPEVAPRSAPSDLPN